MPETKLDAATLEIIHAMNASMGTEKAAKALGVSRETFLRALAGLSMRRGTVCLIREMTKKAALHGNKKPLSDRDSGGAQPEELTDET